MEAPTVKIQDIQSNHDHILTLVGSNSFINWDHFIKNSTDMNKQIDELIRSLALYKEIQQKRFLINMKKLKSMDIPDLLKTVKNKKLPREALKSILSRFDFDAEGKLKLTTSAQDLKSESLASFLEYTSSNEDLTSTLRKTTQYVVAKIHQSGLYQEPAPAKELVSTFKANFPQEILDKLKKQVKVEYQPGSDHISIQTYGQIVHNTFPLVKDEYKRMTMEAREKQRSLINDSKKYVQALIEYLTNTEVIILDAQRAIAKAIGLDQKKVEESEVGFLEKGLAQTVLLIQSGLRTSVKQSIAPQHEVSFQTTKNIIKAQVNMVKEKTPFFKQMFNGIEKSPENFQIMPLVIALTLNDFIFQNFKLEEEDFMKALNDQAVLSSPEVTALFKDMEMAIITLMKETGIINEDMAKVMQTQSKQIQSTLGDFNQNLLAQGALGGVLPGSNPIELLQNQQKYQFEQMPKDRKG